MKSFFIAAIVSCLGQFGYASNLGKEVKVYSDQSGPSLTTVFAYDTDKVLVLTFSLGASDVLSATRTMKSLSWRLFDSVSGQFINDWQLAVNHSSPVTYPGTMALSWELTDEQQVLAGIRSLPNLKIVLAVDQSVSTPVATHFIDLGSYCRSNPANFMNLTTGGSGCTVSN